MYKAHIYTVHKQTYTCLWYQNLMWIGLLGGKISKKLSPNDNNEKRLRNTGMKI